MWEGLSVRMRLKSSVSSQDLVQEVLNHLEVLSQHVALAATDVLMRMTGSKVLDLMGKEE